MPLIAHFEQVNPAHKDAPVVIEVNSAPGFRAKEATTGKDIAGLMMMDYVLSVCKC